MGASLKDQPLNLKPREFSLLALLMSNEGPMYNQVKPCTTSEDRTIPGILGLLTSTWAGCEERLRLSPVTRGT